MTTRERRIIKSLDREEHARARARDRLNAKLRELLRQARVHVVEVRHPQQRRQHDADEPAFFVRVDGVVAAGSARRTTDERRAARSSGSFASDGPILTRADERRPQAAKDAQPGHRDVVAERIRDQVDLVPERRERADPVKLAERRAARLEERLRRNHQDAHGLVIFARIRPFRRAGSVGDEKSWTDRQQIAQFCHAPPFLGRTQGSDAIRRHDRRTRTGTPSISVLC